MQTNLHYEIELLMLGMHKTIYWIQICIKNSYLKPCNCLRISYAQLEHLIPNNYIQTNVYLLNRNNSLKSYNYIKSSYLILILYNCVQTKDYRRIKNRFKKWLEHWKYSYDYNKIFRKWMKFQHKELISC